MQSFCTSLSRVITCLCECICTLISGPWNLVCISASCSLVQSFVGSHWIDQSPAALMNSMASCSTFIASPMLNYWWVMLMCMVTCCPSTMMTTITKPSPPPALYSGCSYKGKVSPEEIYVICARLFTQLVLPRKTMCCLAVRCRLKL